MSFFKKYYPFIGKFSLGAIGFSLGLLLNQIANNIPVYITIIMIIVFAIFGGIYIVISSKKIEPNFDTSALKDEVSQKKEARKGLIIFLSLYKNFSGKKLVDEELKNAVKNGDYNILDIPNTSATNFGHAIKAIKSHLAELSHLWIITSKAPLIPNPITSLEYLSVFKNYIEKEIAPNGKIDVHYGPNYSIDITENSQIAKGTFKMISDIYEEAKKQYKLNADDIIVDVTGGFTIMSVGAVLASLAKEQYIQVIVSDYDKATGNPVSGDKSYPIRIGYAPYIRKE